MRQFVLGQSVQTTAVAIDALGDGAVGFYDLSKVDSNKKPVQVTYNTSVSGGIKTIGCIAVGTKIGSITIPIHGNAFSWVKGSYVAAGKFSQKITVVKRGIVGDYTVIVVKKGQPCNERYKWTATYHVFDPDMTAEAIAAKLGQEIKTSCAGAGVTVVVASDTITVNAIESGVDYSIILADNANMSTLATPTAGTKALFDAEAIKDMYMKAAADAGIEYTYQDGANLVYPNYPLRQDVDTAASYNVFTLKFAEPRAVGTTDEVVHQVVQLAFPTSVATTGLEAILNAIG